MKLYDLDSSRVRSRLSLLLTQTLTRHTADLLVNEVQSSKQDPRLLGEVGDLSVYCIFIFSICLKSQYSVEHQSSGKDNADSEQVNGVKAASAKGYYYRNNELS